jgi:hypothetical protein
MATSHKARSTELAGPTRLPCPPLHVKLRGVSQYYLIIGLLVFQYLLHLILQFKKNLFSFPDQVYALIVRTLANTTHLLLHVQ